MVKEFMAQLVEYSLADNFPNVEPKKLNHLFWESFWYFLHHRSFGKDWNPKRKSLKRSSGTTAKRSLRTELTYSPSPERPSSKKGPRMRWR